MAIAFSHSSIPLKSLLHFLCSTGPIGPSSCYRLVRLPVRLCPHFDAAGVLSLPAALGCQDGRCASIADYISQRHRGSPLEADDWAKNWLARAPLPTDIEGVTGGMYTYTHRAHRESLGNFLVREPLYSLPCDPSQDRSIIEPIRYMWTLSYLSKEAENMQPGTYRGACQGGRAALP